MSKFPSLQYLLRAIDKCVVEQPNATDEDIHYHLMGEDLEIMRHVHDEINALFAILGWPKRDEDQRRKEPKP
jgi:hypothetical protein